MSDTPQGPDWWQASDDKWYPPPRPAMPGDGDAPAVAAPAMAAPGAAPPGAPPAGPPMAPPAGPPGFPAGPPSGGFPPSGPTSGPYGAPPVAPPPGGQNRTPLFIAIGVVAAAAIVGLVVLLSGGDDDDEPTTAPTTEAPPGPETTTLPAGNPPATESQQSGSSEIQVVESGFSNFMGGFDSDERSVAYGFIVENTGDETATDISVSISAYDANGTALASDSVTIYVLRPGERMGIGDEFFGTTFTTDVARLDVQVSEPRDFGSSDVPDEGTLSAEGINTSVTDYNITTTFTAKSSYAQQVDSPSVYAIYRNEAGEIIGGSFGFLDFVPANGSTAGEVTSWEVIPGVASTEVYLDPGFF
ncbi:MAG TPA: FxLYD domain-containing protein [Acidimicrobiales bacterium]